MRVRFTVRRPPSKNSCMNNLATHLWTKGNFAGLTTRPARALIGWIAERDAQILLGIPLHPTAPSPADVRRVALAHAAVEARARGIEQSLAVSSIDDALRDYVLEGGKHPHYRSYFASGCTIRVAYLPDICALQPIVHLDYASFAGHFAELLERTNQQDLESLARITLPLNAPGPPPVHFDDRKHAWTFRSANPDVRIMGNFSARLELAPGLFAMGYGFCVAQPISLVQVVLYRGRYFLKDGYHRCLALLERGITHVPVMFQELDETQKLVVEGRFSDQVILGDHPPMLTDYLRDDVAAEVAHLSFSKTITIRADESHCWGEAAAGRTGP